MIYPETYQTGVLKNSSILLAPRIRLNMTKINFQPQKQYFPALTVNCAAMTDCSGNMKN